MKRRRHTPEQVIRKLREAERLLAEGKATGEVCRHLEVSEATYHRWQPGRRPRTPSACGSWGGKVKIATTLCHGMRAMTLPFESV